MRAFAEWREGQTEFVSFHASAHPWEDWAETFADYLDDLYPFVLGPDVLAKLRFMHDRVTAPR